MQQVFEKFKAAVCAKYPQVKFDEYTGQCYNIWNHGTPRRIGCDWGAHYFVAYCFLSYADSISHNRQREHVSLLVNSGNANCTFQGTAYGNDPQPVEDAIAFFVANMLPV